MKFGQAEMADYPYRPSWVDLLTSKVASLPIPTGLTYAAVAILLVVIFVWVQYWQGAYKSVGFFGWHIFIAVQPLVPLVAMHYLDTVAASALASFQPAFKGDEVAFQETAYRLTTAPPFATVAASFIGVVCSVVLFGFLQDLSTGYQLAHLANTSLAEVTYLVYILSAWFGFGAWVYHTIHQLRVINELYTRQAEVDLAFPEPLYALSRITSRTALILFANSYGWFGVNTANGANHPSQLGALIITNIFFLGLGLLIFIWPLWGAHSLLEQAKSAAMAKNAAYLNKAVHQLHQRVATAEVSDVDGWEKVLSGLHLERSRLVGLATWPWSPGTLRNLLLALIVPIAVWSVQFGLERLLG